MVKVQLKVLFGSNSGKTIPISSARFVIGRGEGCQLRPNSDAISRQHCAVQITANGATARDLGSRNGTFVNGKRIETESVLSTGDVLSVGPLEFEVSVEFSALVPEPLPGGAVVPDSDSRVAAPLQAGSWGDDDIGQWLSEEEVTIDSAETRRFRLDDTNRVAKSTEDIDSGESSEAKTEAADQKKSEQQKSKDTQEAATQMLRRLFTRG